MFSIENNDYDSDEMSVYGFIVYRRDGLSMPKGMITSFNARWYKPNSEFASIVQIEFGVQSPTGDSSDHHNYSMPCVDFDQAKAIVENYRQGISTMLEKYRKQDLYS